jgi:predicted dehydrogenase
MNQLVSRREFLGTAAALPAAAWARGAQTPSEKVQLGLIGCGNIAQAHWKALVQLPQVEVVALADVDAQRLERFAAQVAGHTKKSPRTFKDYRGLLDLKDVNAVTIATPTHWHALQLIHACQAGKDVYCEKPLAHNVVEGRAMVNAAQKHQRVVQIGTQQRSLKHYQDVVQFLRDGKLGKIVEAQSWNLYNAEGRDLAKESDPPAHVDYDLWLGPAPRRPFSPARFHGGWTYWRDYGWGFVLDWNVHHQDIIHLALNVSAPQSVVMFGQTANDNEDRDTPDTVKAVWDYQAPQGKFTVTYTVRRTNALPPDANPDRAGHGILFHGRKGTLIVDRRGWEIIPEKGEKPRKEEGTHTWLPHYQNFIACVKSRKAPASDIETMHQATVACHLANLSWVVGRRLYWDARQEKCFQDAERQVADREASALLAREYRTPWKLPT